MEEFQEYLDEDLKEIKYNQFLTLKLAFLQIKHKKIVQKLLLKCLNFHLDICLEYDTYLLQTPQILDNFLKYQLNLPHLSSLSLNFSYSILGQNPENLQILSNALKNQENLQNLCLNLSRVCLNSSQKNILPLCQGLKSLKSLKSLQFILDHNILKDEMNSIFISISKLSKLNTLKFHLIGNKFGLSSSKTLDSFLILPKNLTKLQSLELNLDLNSIDTPEIESKITQFLNSLTPTIQNLLLSLNSNPISNPKPLFQQISQLKSLKSLELHLSNCLNIFQNKQNVEFLGNSLAELASLECFSLQLKKSLIDFQHFQFLFTPLQTKQNIKSIQLDLNFNNFAENNDENMPNLLNPLSKLTQLTHLSLKLTTNSLGLNPNNLKLLGNQLKNLKELISLDLELRYNKLGESPENILFLTQGIEKLPKLQELSLDFERNYLGNDENNLNNLLNCFKNLPFLQKLKLGLLGNQIGFNEKKNLSLLAEGLEKLSLKCKIDLNLMNNCKIECSDDEKNTKEMKNLFLQLKKLDFQLRKPITINNSSVEQESIENLQFYEL